MLVVAQNENSVPFDAPFCRRCDWKYKTEVNASKNSKVVVIDENEPKQGIVVGFVSFSCYYRNNMTKKEVSAAKVYKCIVVK